MAQKEPFKQCEVVLKVALHPSNAASPFDGVKSQINEMLFRYNEDIEGVLLSYSHVKFSRGKGYGRVMNEQPWIHVDVNAKVVVFCPEIGMIVPAIVSKVNTLALSIISELLKREIFLLST
jgi:DNA-directed RNA polymerase I subunit RPA43